MSHRLSSKLIDEWYVPPIMKDPLRLRSDGMPSWEKNQTQFLHNTAPPRTYTAPPGTPDIGGGGRGASKPEG